MGREVKFGPEARSGLQEGLDILANAVKATLGPRGRHAAIERRFGPPLITKDGVTVARSITLSVRVQNMGAELVKSVASSTNSVAGEYSKLLCSITVEQCLVSMPACHSPERARLVLTCCR